MSDESPRDDAVTLRLDLTVMWELLPAALYYIDSGQLTPSEAYQTLWWFAVVIVE